jgi:hypothetical protein
MGSVVRVTSMGDDNGGWRLGRRTTRKEVSFLKCKMVTHYESPQMEEFANEFGTWLTRKVNGRLPAPHLRLMGASETLWPVLYQTARLTASEGDFADWCEKSDACAFPFFALASEGERKRLDRETKSRLLPLLFPYYDSDFIEALLEYDGVIFLRLSRLPNTRRRVLVTAHETAYVCSTWLGKPLTRQDPAGNVEENQILTWLNEYSTEREQQ